MKCTPWSSTTNGRTVKAHITEAYNTYTAFEMEYSAQLKTKGFVEFKYRKDSKSSGFMVNGEFKFAVNNREVLVDFKSTNQSDWQVFKYQFADAGMYTLTWIYTKYS